MDKERIINEKTLIPLGALSLIFGASMWLTSIWRQGEANASQIDEVKEAQIRSVEDFKTRQARQFDILSGKLDKLDEKIDRLYERRK